MSPPENEELTVHLDGCASCRLTIGALAEPGSVGAPPLPSDQADGSPLLRAGDHLGPYRIEGWLGGGAMGDLYRAFDERLKRPLALKRVRRRLGSPELEAQLWREAQTLARLRHPNVVAVHDAGVTDGRAWIAMELVDGVNLREWTQTPRPAREVLEVFRQAALGLAAAHQAGVVHRDFKPENVLVGRDGRAFVTDFGLAELAGSDDEAKVVAGMPAYMSPEQVSGGRVDPRADQYSFCIALYEALEGRRPGETLTWKSKAPRAVKAAVARGLEPLATGRFDSIASLAHALEPRAPRSFVWLAGAAVLLVASAGGAMAYRRANLCSSGPAQAAQTWNQQHRAAITAAARTPFALETQARLLPLLDQWSKDWTEAFVDRCEATRVRGEQSEQLLDAQLRCLDVQRRKVGQLLELVESSSRAEELGRALPAFFAIAPPSECLVARGASARAALPADASAARRIEAVRFSLDQAAVVASTGRYHDGLERVRALQPEVTTIGFKPLAAQYQLELARSYLLATQPDPAVEPLGQAFTAAVALGDDELAFEATLLQAQLLGVDHADFAQAHAKLKECHAWLDRLASPPARERQLAALEGFIDTHSGEYDAARAPLQRAVQLARQQRPPNPADLAEDLVNLAVLDYGSFHVDQAELEAKETIELTERAFGPHHRLSANAHEMMGLVHYERGDYPAALDEYQKSLDARLQATPDDVELGDCHLNVSQALAKLTRIDEAVTHARESLRIHQKGKLDEAATADQAFLATLESQLGHGDEALKQAYASLKWREEKLGPLHRDTGAALYALADVQWAHRDLSAAEASFRRALTIDAKQYGDNSELAGLDVAGIGKSLAREGKLADAQATLERALAMIDKANPKSPRRAAAALQLARVLLERRDFAAALTQLETIAAGKPPGWTDQVRLAWLLHRAHDGLGHGADATAFANEARALLGQHPEVVLPERAEALGPGSATAPKQPQR